MSLIGDALRKARQETADRESERQGILFSAKIADSPSRSNLGLGLALGAIIAVVATVAGGVAVWWVLGLGDNDQDQRQQSTAVAVSKTPEEPASESVGGAFIPPDPEAEELPNVNDPPTETAETGIASDPVPDGISDGDSVSVSGSNGGSGSGSGDDRATDDPTTSRPQDINTADSHIGFVGTEDGEAIYILEADLGSVHLSLDFLVSRAEDPFAEINGVELHLGGVIEGFRVKSIESDRVTLSNGRRTIVLRTP